MKNKTVKIELRISPEEKEQIRQLANSANLKIGEYIRKICLNKQPQFLSIKEQEELNELRKELFRLIQIGNLYHEHRTKEYYSLVEKTKSFYNKIIRRK
jgi:hypothetical protein